MNNKIFEKTAKLSALSFDSDPELVCEIDALIKMAEILDESKTDADELLKIKETSLKREDTVIESYDNASVLSNAKTNENGYFSFMKGNINDRKN